MTTSLLNTKLAIPILRPIHVSRTRLIDQLNSDFQVGDTFARKFTLISAPAGFGKTSLVIDWLCTVDLDIAWYSLDENDSDSVRFLKYFITALQQIAPGLGDATLTQLQSPQLPPPEVLLTPLVNDIAQMHTPFVLVIDDYHYIQSFTVHQYMSFLIENQPLQMHLVLLTREDPPFPLHRFRARGQMLEIRQEGIRFTLEESAAFLSKVIDIDLSLEDIKKIERRTEGWVTGMQLLALSLTKHSDPHEFILDFTRNDHYILDYLFEETFQIQSKEVQDFLLKTSILDQLSPSLCSAVTGRDDSTDLLCFLEKTNLFIVPLDIEHSWYRYHRLFLELLRQRMRIRKEITKRSLHQKASIWYEENGYPEGAIHHALEGEDWERAVVLIEQASDSLLKSGAVATMLKWFKKVPIDVILSRPFFCLTYSWPLILVGRVEEAEPLLKAAEEMAGDDSQLLGEIASAQAFQAQTQGDESRMIERSERALSLLPESDLNTRGILELNLGIAYWHSGDMVKAGQALNKALPVARQTGNKYGEISALFFHGRVKAVKGQLRDSATVFNQIVSTNAKIPIIALAYLDLSALNYEWNDLSVSISHLEHGEEMIAASGNLEFRIAACMLQARLKLAQGDTRGALDVLNECDTLEGSNLLPVRTQARKAACFVEIALASGDLELAEYWGKYVTKELDAHPFYRFLNLTPVRLLIAKGQLEAASDLLSDSYNVAKKYEWKYGLIALRVMQSIAASYSEIALKYLIDALKMGQQESFIRTFTNWGPSLSPLLKEAAQQGVSPEYVGKILSVIESQTNVTPAGLPPDVEVLSEREMEVMRLLAAGLTNREIAEQLIISISTVKSHVHHICGKLGATNRTEAVALARQSGLL
jgi:LuxR family maltose regulon positive regulatory protein